MRKFPKNLVLQLKQKNVHEVFIHGEDDLSLNFNHSFYSWYSTALRFNTFFTGKIEGNYGFSLLEEMDNSTFEDERRLHGVKESDF